MTQVFTFFEGRAPSNEPALGPKEVKFSVKCVILCQKKCHFSQSAEIGGFVK